MEKIIVDKDYIWQRIDKFLTKRFQDYSRNFFQHIFERWGILVNGKLVKKSYKLKEGDIIQIDNLQRYLEPVILEEAPKIDLPILLEKQDYLVIYKPKWVLSHPNSVWDIKTPSVVWFLYHRYKDLPSIKNFIRAWLIHRLDKETDWLMIVVKTERWLKYFKDLFQKKSQLVENFLNNLSYNIDKLRQLENSIPLKKFYKAQVNITNKGKEFINSVQQFPYYIIEEVRPKVPYYIPKIWITKILWVYKDNLDIEILTWRTHQIRYHLAQKWLPIKWDYLYWKKDSSPLKLTAYRLVFKDVDWILQDIKLDNV